MPNHFALNFLYHFSLSLSPLPTSICQPVVPHEWGAAQCGIYDLFALQLFSISGDKLTHTA